MAFVVKKRCVRCLKVLDENGNCVNQSCPLGKIDRSTGNGEILMTPELAVKLTNME